MLNKIINTRYWLNFDLSPFIAETFIAKNIEFSIIAPKIIVLKIYIFKLNFNENYWRIDNKCYSFTDWIFSLQYKQTHIIKQSTLRNVIFSF